MSRKPKAVVSIGGPRKKTVVPQQIAEAFEQKAAQLGAETPEPKPTKKRKRGRPPKQTGPRVDMHIVIPESTGWRLGVGAAMSRKSKSELIADALEAHLNKLGIPIAP